MSFDPDSFDPQAGNTGRLPAEAAGLSEGAKAFARQYLPADDDSGCIATFEWVNEFKPAKSRVASEAQGQPVEIFEDVLYIRKNIRGNSLLEVHRPATEGDKRQFPFSWQEFQKGENARARGTALIKLGLDSPIIRAMQAHNVYTIEDLASVSDNNLQHLGIGSREMRVRAQEYVRTNAAASEATHEADSLRDTVNQQSAQLAQALALVERLTEANQKLSGAPPKVKRGRKPKVATEPPAEG